MEKEVLTKNILVTGGGLIASTLMAIAFSHFSLNSTSVAVIYVLAVMLIWLGNQLSIDLSIAAIVVYGSRIFNNLSQIRHYLLRGRKAEEK